MPVIPMRNYLEAIIKKLLCVIAIPDNVVHDFKGRMQWIEEPASPGKRKISQDSFQCLP
jgi:hypothetical protein